MKKAMCLSCFDIVENKKGSKCKCGELTYPIENKDIYWITCPMECDYWEKLSQQKRKRRYAAL